MTKGREKYAIWPEGGCSLQEALERTSDPEQWCRYVHAEHQSIAHVDDVPLQTIIIHLFEHLARGELIATGAKNGFSQARSVIESRAWVGMEIADWDHSVGHQHVKATTWYEIRVLPLLHAPCARETLSAMTFRDAFNRFVLRDPEVRSLTKLVPKNDVQAKPILDDGQFPVENGNFEDRWPAAMEQYENLAKVLNEHRFFCAEPITLSVSTQNCWLALADRYGRLLQVSKQFGLRGTAVSTGTVTEISEAELSRPSAWIDVRNGDLLDKKKDGQFELLWRGLSFFHVKPTISDGPPLVTIEPKVGPEKKSLSRAEMRRSLHQACVSWLLSLMNASPHERTQSKQELWTQARVKWPGLSERDFLDARNDAIRLSGATAWGTAGAPKKSLR